jgi:hypothetical protein
MCLMTEAARQRLTVEQPVRRVCQARLAGMQDSVVLYELGAHDPSDAWLKLRRDYEQALAHFEKAEYAECICCCEPLLETDRTSAWLHEQAKQRIAKSQMTPDPVFQFEK